jgi:hypothetical protein
LAGFLKINLRIFPSRSEMKRTLLLCAAAAVAAASTETTTTTSCADVVGQLLASRTRDEYAAALHATESSCSPETPDAWHLRSFAERALGRYASAEASLVRALSLVEPAHPAGPLCLSDAKLASECLTAALTELRAVASLEGGASSAALVDVPDAQFNTSAASSSAGGLTDLQDWVGGCRGRSSVGNVRLRHYHTGLRGMHVARAVGKGEDVLSLGLEHIITAEVARASPAGRALAKVADSLTSLSHVALAVYLLTERATLANNNSTSSPSPSFYAPYITALPASFDSLPLFWLPAEREWLRGSQLPASLETRREEWGADYFVALEVYPALAKVAKVEQYLWARTVVGSRAFSVTINGVKTVALVPLADMANHGSGVATKNASSLPQQSASWVVDDEHRMFLLRAQRPIVPGAQVFLSFGATKANEKFLADYGFAIPRNVDANGHDLNRVQIRLALANDTSLKAKKALLADGKT